MLTIKYVKKDLPWLKMNDIRELILEAVCRPKPLFIEGNLTDKVGEALLKPAEEIDVSIITAKRLSSTLESRASKIEGRPFCGDLRFYGLGLVDKIMEDSFAKLREG